MWGEELQTGPLPRTELLEAERAARQLEDQVQVTDKPSGAIYWRIYLHTAKKLI